MDIFTAIKERRSCRNYASEPIDEETLSKILECATWAPSPANNQPWEFVVITNDEVKAKILDEAEHRKQAVFEASGWNWLNKYRVDFLKQVPAIVAVLGDPKKTGADMFLPEGNVAYQHACAAAIQNMMLAAHAFGLGTLWFTLFDKNAVREILGVGEEKDPLALICMGKPGGDPLQTPRKSLEKKATFMK